jgi:hypothetical protein
MRYTMSAARLASAKRNGERRRNTPEKFWSRVNKTETCWLWTGRVDVSGYGVFRVYGRGVCSIKAHRYAWELTKGPIPEGLRVLHRCDVRACLNPAHLFIGTDADNMRDKCEKGRQPRGEAQGSARLTAEQVIAIRRDYRIGKPGGRSGLCLLAKRLGVNVYTIHNVLKGKTWRHLLQHG